MAISSTSFKPGNTAALGNDKTLRFTTFIDKALDKVVPDSLEKYNELRTYRQVLAEGLTETAVDLLKSGKPEAALAYIKEIADRTEGKPKQSTELSGEVKIVTPIYSGKSFIEPEND